MVCYHQNIHQDIGLMAFGPTVISIDMDLFFRGTDDVIFSVENR